MTEEEKRQQMLCDPVELLVCRLAVPTIITMLITAFYNMADTYFVGRLDTVSTAAVGLALPLMNVVQALGFMFGHGSGNYISGKLGAGDVKAAQIMGDTAAVLSFCTGFIIAAAGFANRGAAAVLLGADEELLESTVRYITVLFFGIPFQMASFTLNNQLRFRGRAFYGMIGMAGGSVLNVILDPVFIYLLDMKIEGAALATVISQCVSFFILMAMSGRLPFKKPELLFSGEIIVSIFKYGTPSLLRQGVTSAAAVCMNHAAVIYGAAAVAAVSVVNRIVMLGASVIIGLGQGFQPVCGFNAGAGKFGRVRKVFAFCIKLSTVFMAVFGTAVFILAPSVIAFFRSDPEVIEAGTLMLRSQCVTAPCQGIIVMTNMIMQNMGRTVRASVLAVARQGLFFIPLVYILAGSFEFTGIQLSQSAADLLTALVTLPMTALTIKELSRKDSGAIP